MKNKKDLLGFIKIAVSAIFLFNPTVHIVDPLPDFIGYFLIVLGLTAVSYMSEPLFEARKSFIYLSLLSLVKTGVALTFPDSRTTFTVLMAFVFAVGEAVLFIPAVSNLFDGLTTLGMRHASDSVFYVPVKEKKRRRAEKLLVMANAAEGKRAQSLSKKAKKLLTPKTQGSLKILTVAAFLIRAAGALIPVLPNLMMYDELYFVTGGQIIWSKYTGIFYILSWIAGLWIGIPWMSRFGRYFRGIAGESNFVDAIYKKYCDEVLSDEGRLAAQRMRKVMILACVAAFLTLQFPIDYVNATPNALSAACLIAAFLYLTPYEKKLTYVGMGTGVVWAALSALGVWLQTDYTAKNYDPKAAVAFDGAGRGMADELYLRMEIFSYVEAFFFLVTALVFAFVFINVLNSHMLLLTESRRKALEREEKGLEKLLLGVCISGGVVILFNFALTFVTKYFTGAWIINALAVAVFFVFTLLSYFRIYDKIYYPLKKKY